MAAALRLGGGAWRLDHRSALAGRASNAIELAQAAPLWPAYFSTVCCMNSTVA